MELPNILFPDFTDDMYAKMCHTIGLDKKHDNRKYFYPFRNYYDCGECDLESFDKLVEKELAEKSENGFYHLTLLGINTLSIISGIWIYNTEAKWDADLKRYLIKVLCKADVYCGYGCWFPTSISSICRVYRLPLHRVRKIVKELVNDGYMVKASVGGCDEEGYPYCNHGYFLTEKAKEWEAWKKAYKEEMDYLNESLKGGNDV